VQSVSGLRRFLVENVVDLSDLESRKAKDDGINIEGLSWDPARKLILLGLRTPVIDGKALVVPLKVRDPRGPFSIENLEAGKVDAIRLPLGGMGIRSIEYDERQAVFHIIAGATDSQDKTDFKLWEWTGQADGSALRDVTTLTASFNPKALAGSAGIPVSGVIVFDSSRYLKMQ
jgi:hypothetical protein